MRTKARVTNRLGRRPRTTIVRLAAVALLTGVAGCLRVHSLPRSPLRIVIMDPLAGPLACACVEGYAQRDYHALGRFLEKRLDRPVEILHTEDLATVSRAALEGTAFHAVIGRHSVVAADAARTGLPIGAEALLTDKQGQVTLRGLFVVRDGDPARSIDDLTGYDILFGPEEAAERAAAARAVLEAHGIPFPDPPRTSPACSTAAISVLENEADAGLVSSYSMPLLVACKTIDKGQLRIIGRTGAQPFVTVFATDALAGPEREAFLDALLDTRGRSGLLRVLESRDGFVPFGGRTSVERAEWRDWRGPLRAGNAADLAGLEKVSARLLWQHPMTGLGLSGLTLSGGRLLVADKDLAAKADVWRCLQADTGVELWRYTYPAEDEMDYSNSPRAQPVADGENVYVLGAFGDLSRLRLEDGSPVWKTNILERFRGELPAWGTCSTPLLIGDYLIVNPGAPAASLAALDRQSGNPLWRSPGRASGYGSFISGIFGGVWQVIGHDAVSLGGWDPVTGRRLWELTPPVDGDFNVPTPVALEDGTLLVSTENNGTRRYGFGTNGQILAKPLAVNPDLVPDIATPVLAGGCVYGTAGSLVCLDAETLETRWRNEDPPFDRYCTLLSDGTRVAALSLAGELVLFEAGTRRYKESGRVNLFEGLPAHDREIWSHPVIAGSRIYCRDQLAVYCFLLE